LKNKLRKILVGLILSLSAVIYGYSLKEITSVPIKTIMSMYSVTLDKFTTQSILIGILPVGSLIGAIITHFMLQKTERLTGMYIFAIVNAIAVVLINITDFGSLVAGRFL
jgi:formate-dependent nitrite reductase membrane component NrfD